MKSNDVQKKHKLSFRWSSTIHGLQLIVIQSTICLLVIFLAVMLKWIGGDVYVDLSSSFRDAMLTDPIVSVNAQAYASQEYVSSKTVAPLKQGTVTSLFGKREDPFKTEDLSFHEGIDIAAEEGEELFAFASGIVTTVEYDENGYGHYMVVTTDNDERYLYAHCSAISVQVGERVKAGDTVAFVGDSGRTTGAHLHFEWIVNDTPIDPISVLPEGLYV